MRWCVLLSVAALPVSVSLSPFMPPKKPASAATPPSTVENAARQVLELSEAKNDLEATKIDLVDQLNFARSKLEQLKLLFTGREKMLKKEKEALLEEKDLLEKKIMRLESVSNNLGRLVNSREQDIVAVKTAAEQDLFAVKAAAEQDLNAAKAAAEQDLFAVKAAAERDLSAVQEAAEAERSSLRALFKNVWTLVKSRAARRFGKQN